MKYIMKEDKFYKNTIAISPKEMYDKIRQGATVEDEYGNDITKELILKRCMKKIDWAYLASHIPYEELLEIAIAGDYESFATRRQLEKKEPN